MCFKENYRHFMYNVPITKNLLKNILLSLTFFFIVFNVNLQI